MRGLFPVLAVAVTYTEVVPKGAVLHRRLQNKAVLVLFIRIVGHIAYPSRKSIFSDDISFDKAALLQRKGLSELVWSVGS